MSLEITQLPSVWQQQWQEQGFQQPSLIQEATYEALKDKKNLLGIAPTGSGKTLAYVLPLLQNVTAGAGMQLLIATASQELGMQVVEVVREWSQPLGLKVQSVIGGANVKRQIEKLKQKPEILVGTAGRIGELLNQRKIKGHQIQALVLDEADQLLADPLTQPILKAVGKQCQLVLFSATGQQITETAARLREDLQVVDVSSQDKSAAQISHCYLQVPWRKRTEELRRLAHIEAFQGLVFFNEVSDLGNVEEKLLFRNLAVSSIASDQNKLVRKGAIQKFKAGELTLLLATDIAARGLDIEDLPYVVNYDLPLSQESYLHRAGRTGRMGKAGVVLTLLPENGLKDYLKLMKKLELQAQELFLYEGQLQTTAKLSQPLSSAVGAAVKKKAKNYKK